MGLIRFLLASAVVFSHTKPPLGIAMTGPIVSVETFFMISGFYMGLILDQRYTGPNSYARFLLSRALRIYPLYFIVLGCVLLLVGATYLRRHTFGPLYIYSTGSANLSPLFILYLVISHLAIVGQDLALFLGFDANHQLQFTTQFWASDPAVFHFMPLPQAWSLSLELCFYAIAPWLARMRTRGLLAILVATIILRLAIVYSLHLDNDPWESRFFPIEMTLFTAGLLAYRLTPYTKLLHRNAIYAAHFLMVATVILFATLGMNRWIFFSAFALCMPAIFALTRDNIMDRMIGDLSYPIYLSHLFVLWTLGSVSFFSRSGLSQSGVFILLATTIFSVGIHFVVAPIERFRVSKYANAASHGTARSSTFSAHYH